MTRYVDLTETYLIHEKMLAVGGGRAGIRDFSLLHSAVELPKVTFGGKLLYETVWKQAASLIHSLIKNHPFNDGNKRTGFFTSLRFLNLNGYEIQCSKKEVLNSGEGRKLLINHPRILKRELLPSFLSWHQL
ncbi:type II toxin-antitoxin system death-on-curing family toxin [Candidatus Roizmanbacteria bacterium]|nr:type II toxin-antitoxin system death-on-curing family toxin [Candidatus Roizmanbacteria bacterium]